MAGERWNRVTSVKGRMVSHLLRFDKCFRCKNAGAAAIISSFICELVGFCHLVCDMYHSQESPFSSTTCAVPVQDVAWTPIGIGA